MSETGVNWSSNPCLPKFSNLLPQWRFGILTTLVLARMVAVWSIDGCIIKSVLQDWRFRQEYVNLKISAISRDNLTENHVGLSINSSSIVKNQTQKLTNVTQLNAELSSENQINISEIESITVQNSIGFSVEFNKSRVHSENVVVQKSLSWVYSNDLEPQFTSKFLARWLVPGGEPCKDSKTAEIAILGLDGRDMIELPAGEIQEFGFQALDDDKNPRCLGGDYFETDLSGDLWKSKPVVKDFGNGSYSVSLQVHPDFDGIYNFSVILLLRHFEGLKFSPWRFAYDKQLRKILIRFYKSSAKLPELQLCAKSDFDRDFWSGRWTRHGQNDHCKISNDGRYRCLASDFPCKSPWCNGSLGSLESNGWVYSAHCSFRLFTADSAWNCLKNRWIFFWGDSNHVDTIRNMLNF